MADRGATILAVLVGIALASMGAGAGVAIAQQDGVFVDPDSPAGKEYALPFDSARRDAAGDGRSGAAAGGDAPPAFGVGISPRSGRPSEPRGPDTGRSLDETSPKGGGGGGSGAVRGAEASGAVAKAVAQNSGGLSAGWLTAFVAFGVLLLGGMIGLSVRALRGPDQAH